MLPYGSSTHGHVRTPGSRRGKVRKVNHKHGGVKNLAYRRHGELADGFTKILAGCRAVQRPGGHVVITARPYRRHGELIDIPGMVVADGINAGLELVEQCSPIPSRRAHHQETVRFNGAASRDFGRKKLEAPQCLPR